MDAKLHTKNWRPQLFPGERMQKQKTKIEFGIRDFWTNCQCIVQGWWWLNQRWGHSDASSRSLWFFLSISHVKEISARREQKHSRHVFDSRAHAKSCRSLNSIEGSVWNSKSKDRKKSKTCGFSVEATLHRSPRRWLFRIWVSWKRHRRWRTAAASWWSVALCLERPMVLFERMLLLNQDDAIIDKDVIERSRDTDLGMDSLTKLEILVFFYGICRVHGRSKRCLKVVSFWAQLGISLSDFFWGGSAKNTSDISIFLRLLHIFGVETSCFPGPFNTLINDPMAGEDGRPSGWRKLRSQRVASQVPALENC